MPVLYKAKNSSNLVLSIIHTPYVGLEVTFSKSVPELEQFIEENRLFIREILKLRDSLTITTKENPQSVGILIHLISNHDDDVKFNQPDLLLYLYSHLINHPTYRDTEILFAEVSPELKELVKTIYNESINAGDVEEMQAPLFDISGRFLFPTALLIRMEEYPVNIQELPFTFLSKEDKQVLVQRLLSTTIPNKISYILELQNSIAEDKPTVGITRVTETKIFVEALLSVFIESGVKVRYLENDDSLADLSQIDALVIPGGDNIPELYYSESPFLPNLERIDPENQNFITKELSYIRRALDLKMPMFGICRGLQLLVVSEGGRIQNADGHHPEDDSYDTLVHLASEPNNIRELFGETFTPFEGPSYHHQAVDPSSLPDHLRVSMHAKDGTIKAVEIKDPFHYPSLFTQFHPEAESFTRENRLLLDYFIQSAHNFYQRRDKGPYPPTAADKHLRKEIMEELKERVENQNKLSTGAASFSNSPTGFFTNKKTADSDSTDRAEAKRKLKK